MRTSTQKAVRFNAALKSWLVLALALSCAYVGSYWLVMDRSQPTGWFILYQNKPGEHDYPSSFRWAPKVLDKNEKPTIYPDITPFNWFYAPMDRLYFSFFPRK